MSVLFPVDLFVARLGRNYFRAAADASLIAPHRILVWDAQESPQQSRFGRAGVASTARAPRNGCGDAPLMRPLSRALRSLLKDLRRSRMKGQGKALEGHLPRHLVRESRDPILGVQRGGALCGLCIFDL